MLPRHTDPVSRKKNDNFDSEIESMRGALKKEKGVIIYFSTVDWRWYLPTLDYLNRIFSLRLVFQGQDGVIVSLQDSSSDK